MSTYYLQCNKLKLNLNLNRQDAPFSPWLVFQGVLIVDIRLAPLVSAFVGGGGGGGGGV